MAIEWELTPVISTITLPTGGTYYFKDEEAREQIEALASYSDFLGVTGTEIEDGDTTTPIMIGGKAVYPEPGNIVLYGSKEFIWNGTAWAEFGDLSAITSMLGDLAYVDTASTDYTPEGEVSGEFNGEESNVSLSVNTRDLCEALNNNSNFYGEEGNISASGTVASQDIVISGGEGTTTYTPAGTIVNKGFTGTQSTISLNYTPEGTVTASFEGSQGTVTTSGVPAGVVTIGEIVASLTGNYTPQGTINGVVTAVTTTSVTVNEVTDRGTLPSLTGDYTSLLKVNVSNEDLTFTAVSNWFSAGTLPTISSVAFNAVSSVTTSDVALSGTTVLISAGFSGTDTTFSGTFTPAGNVVNGSFVGTPATISTSYTPSGTISADFSGTGTRLTGTFASANVSVSGTFTPQGTLSMSAGDGTIVAAEGTFTPVGTIDLSFSGTPRTITVSADNS